MKLMSLKTYSAWKPVTAKAYVQSGLFAHWDGIENVGYGTHSDSTSVWTDLTGNGHNFDVSPEFLFGDNKLTIKDSKNLVCRRLDGDFDALKNGYTYEAFLMVRKPDDSDMPKYLFGLGENCYVGFYYKSSLDKLCPQFRSTGGLGGTGGSLAAANLSYGDMDRNSPSLITINWDPVANVMNAYINGILKRSLNGGGLVGDEYPARVGYGLNSAAGFGSVNGGNNATYGKGPLNGGDYYAFRVYSRALTAEEIAANYAVDCARFKIGGAS